MANTHNSQTPKHTNNTQNRLITLTHTDSHITLFNLLSKPTPDMPSSICCRNWHPTCHLLCDLLQCSSNPAFCCRDLLPPSAAICCCDLLPSAVVATDWLLQGWSLQPDTTRPDPSFLPLWLCDPNPILKLWSFITFNLSWYLLYSYICLIIGYLLCNWLLFDCCNYVFLNVSNKIKKICVFMIFLWIIFY